MSTTAERLSELCFYLPLGMLVAVAVVELTRGRRKSLDVDKAIVVLLVAASIVSFFSAFTLFAQRAGIDSRIAMKGAGIGVAIGILSALGALLKQQCYVQNLVAMARAKSTLAKRPATASVWPLLYGITLLVSLLGIAYVSMARPDLPQSDSTVVEVQEEAIGPEEPEPSIIAESSKPIPKEPEEMTPVAMEEDSPEPEPAVAVAEPEVTAPKDMSEPNNDLKEKPETTLVSKESETVLFSKEDPPATKPVVAARKVNPGAARAFVQHIVPILKNRCYSCHGPKKQKGRLRLDTPAHIRKGGNSGPVVVAWEPQKSYIYTSITLPDDDPDIMPAKGKPLSKNETTRIRQWIEAGAPMGDGQDNIAANASSHPSTVKPGMNLPPNIVNLLEKSHIIARPSKDGLLEIDCSHTRNYEEVTLDLGMLTPIATQIGKLDLSKTRVNDIDMAHVAKMTQLTILQLNRTKVGDAGMKHLAGLKKLKSLNLYGTKVTDAGLKLLHGLTTLEKLFLFNSDASSEGAKSIEKAIPGLTVNL